jgi:hypothetical protein
MDAHHGDKARIVNLPPTDTVIVNQATPYGVNLSIVGKKSELALDESDFLLGFGNRQAEPVAIYGPSQNVPELHNILRAAEQADVLSKNLVDRTLDDRVQ